VKRKRQRNEQSGWENSEENLSRRKRQYGRTENGLQRRENRNYGEGIAPCIYLKEINKANLYLATQ